MMGTAVSGLSDLIFLASSVRVLLAQSAAGAGDGDTGWLADVTERNALAGEVASDTGWD